MKNKLYIPLLGIAFCAMSHVANAHHRDFTFMRDWYLPYKGEREIESRSTFTGKTREFMQEFEFELGITDHFAIEPGFGYHGQPGEKTHLDEWDVELRFNFLNFQYNKVLPALNVEYEHPIDTNEPTHGELKFIFSYYTKKGENISANINIGQELSHGHEKESEVHFGYVRPFGEEKKNEEGHVVGIRGGAESVFDFKEHNLGVGPVLVYRASKHLNALATYMFAINHRSTAHDIFKLIFEWEF